MDSTHIQEVAAKNIWELFISVINQLDAQNFCFTISLFHASTCFEHHVLIIRRSKLHHTASSIITPIGGRLVNRLREPDDEHMCSKHVKAWNKLIVKQKFCVSSWLITEINILGCTVRETSKNVSFFFSPNALTCPCGLRGLPSWAWQICNQLLRLGCPRGAVTLSRWCE